MLYVSNEMPIMRGRDAARLIREMGYTGAIIGVTGNVLNTDIEDFIAQGADYVIKKPMNTEKFNIAMDCVWQSRRKKSI